MFNGKLVVHALRQDYERGVGVLIGVVKHEGMGDFAYIKGPLPFTPHDPSRMIVDPTFDGAAGNEFLQAALDCAWAMGLRPGNYRDERPEQITAMDNHLQDMRRMVFGETITIPPFIKQGTER